MITKKDQILDVYQEALEKASNAYQEAKKEATKACLEALKEERHPKAKQEG